MGGLATPFASCGRSVPNEAMREGELVVSGAIAARRDQQAIPDETLATSLDVIDVLIERSCDRADRKGAPRRRRHGKQLQRERVKAIELRIDESPYGIWPLGSDPIQAGHEPPPLVIPAKEPILLEIVEQARDEERVAAGHRMDRGRERSG